MFLCVCDLGEPGIKDTFFLRWGGPPLRAVSFNGNKMTPAEQDAIIAAIRDCFK